MSELILYFVGWSIFTSVWAVSSIKDDRPVRRFVFGAIAGPFLGVIIPLGLVVNTVIQLGF